MLKCIITIMLLTQVKPSYLRGFHKITQAHRREGKIPTSDWFLGRLSSMIPASFTLCLVYQKLFVMFILSRMSLNLVVSLWGKTEESFQTLTIGFIDNGFHQCPRLGCRMQVLGTWCKCQQSRVWCPKKQSQPWYQCIFEGRQWHCRGDLYWHRSYFPPSKHRQGHPSILICLHEATPCNEVCGQPDLRSHNIFEFRWIFWNAWLCTLNTARSETPAVLLT